MTCAVSLSIVVALFATGDTWRPGDVAARPSCDQRTQPSEKELRSQAQRKINSQLLYEIYRRRGEAERKGVPPGETGVRIDKQGRALVDVRAKVTPALQRKIRSLGGTIVSTAPDHDSTLAHIPILRLERLAEDPAVRFIEPAAEATTLR